MDIIFILIPISFLLGAIFLGIFIFAVKGGQYDDLDSPQFKILIDEDSELEENEKLNKRSTPPPQDHDI